jgi:hypothetical protein
MVLEIRERYSDGKVRWDLAHMIPPHEEAKLIAKQEELKHRNIEPIEQEQEHEHELMKGNK